MQVLRVEEFMSSEELCIFVNGNDIDVETIVVFNNLLQLFYWD